MARKSHQAGCLQWHNGQWTLLYWLKDHATGRRTQKRECAAFSECRNQDDKKAAQEVAIEFLKPINQLNSNPKLAAAKASPKGVTFEEFTRTRWASYVAKRKMEPGTVSCYRSMIERHILPALGDLPMAEITTSTMTDFFDSLYGELKEGSISNIYSLLALMFDIALEYKLIGSKPIAKRLHKPEYERAEKPILSVEDARRILKGLSHSHRLFVAVLAVLPVRANEGAALRWMNVDFERGILSVTHGLWSGKLKTKLKTKATRRRFEIPNGLLSALKQWRALSKFDRDEDFIFCNSVGRPLDPGHFRTYVLYPLMDSLETKRGSHTHGLHILRHTAATVLHEITGDIEVAQRALGHARRSTTEGIYDHAEKTVDVKTTGLLLEWLLGSESDLLQQTETVN